MSVPANTSIVLIIGSIVPPGAAYGVLAQVYANDSVIALTQNPAYQSDDDASADPDADTYTSLLNYSIRTDFIAQNQVLYAMQWMPGYEGSILLQTEDPQKVLGDQGFALGGMGIDRAIFVAAAG